jgi:hypothetical protein
VRVQITVIPVFARGGLSHKFVEGYLKGMLNVKEAIFAISVTPEERLCAMS